MSARNPPPAYDFATTRDAAMMVARLALHALNGEHLDRTIDDLDRAQSLGPILDPTLARDAATSADEHRRFLTAVRDFRRALETFRPRSEAGDARHA